MALVAVDALASELNDGQQASPDLFHNTFIVLNNLPIIQLQNKTKLEELAEMNKKIVAMDEDETKSDPGSQKEAEHRKKRHEKELALGLILPED